MDYTKLTIYELLLEYRNVTRKMQNYEGEGRHFRARYKTLTEEENEILAEAKRRDLVQEEHDWDEFNHDYIENYEKLNG